MKILAKVAAILVLIGAINWGLVGLFRFDLIAALLGGIDGAEGLIPRVIYTLVGLSGLFIIYNKLKKK